MFKFNWNHIKNEKLKKERGVSFEEVVFAIENGGLLDDAEHASRENQRVFIVLLTEYAYLVPYVSQGKNTFFLKTIIPSRKATKKYLK